MIVECTGCGARYDVDGTVIPAAGLKVQCSVCQKSWLQPTSSPAAGMSAKPAPVVATPPKRAPSKPPPPKKPARKKPIAPAPPPVAVAPEPDNSLQEIDASDLEALALDDPPETKAAPEVPLENLPSQEDSASDERARSSEELSDQASESSKPAASDTDDNSSDAPNQASSTFDDKSDTDESNDFGSAPDESNDSASDLDKPSDSGDDLDDLNVASDATSDESGSDAAPQDDLDIDLDLDLDLNDEKREDKARAANAKPQPTDDHGVNSPDLTELADFLGEGEFGDLDDDPLDNFDSDYDSDEDSDPSYLFSDDDESPLASSPAEENENADEKEEEFAFFSASDPIKSGGSFISLGSLYGWAVLIMLIGGLAGGGYVMRNEVVNAIPAAKLLYERLEIPVDFFQDNLEIVDGQVKIYRTSTPAGDSLTVAGVVRNRSNAPERTRMIRIDMLDEFGKVMQSELTSPVQELLLPGEESLFQANIQNPENNVVDAALTLTQENVMIDLE